MKNERFRPLFLPGYLIKIWNHTNLLLLGGAGVVAAVLSPQNNLFIEYLRFLKTSFFCVLALAKGKAIVFDWWR